LLLNDFEHKKKLVKKYICCGCPDCRNARDQKRRAVRAARDAAVEAARVFVNTVFDEAEWYTANDRLNDAVDALETAEAALKEVGHG
jgi:hypothetical protein